VGDKAVAVRAPSRQFYHFCNRFIPFGLVRQVCNRFIPLKDSRNRLLRLDLQDAKRANLVTVSFH
jgi:hypothetical protein